MLALALAVWLHSLAEPRYYNVKGELEEKQQRSGHWATRRALPHLLARSVSRSTQIRHGVL